MLKILEHLSPISLIHANSHILFQFQVCFLSTALRSQEGSVSLQTDITRGDFIHIRCWLASLEASLEQISKYWISSNISLITWPKTFRKVFPSYLISLQLYLGQNLTLLWQFEAGAA